jgi:hypothetical protein
LANGTYFIRVKGRNGSAVGPPSNQIIVSVPLPAVPPQ